MPDYKDIQIIINSRDRLTCLQALVDWLLTHGYTNVNILDNDSKYPPLLEYYKNIDSDGVKVYRTGKNLLSKALWSWTEAWRVVKPPFVYTDSDVVPTEDCLEDIVAFLMDVAQHLGNPYKVGPALKVDDIPDCYSQAAKVRAWERDHNWTDLCTFRDVPIYSAGIDTTFALYPAFRPFQISGVRVGAPYVFRHLPWYVNSANVSEEDIFYESRVARGTHSWGIDKCHSIAVERHYKSVMEDKQVG